MTTRREVIEEARTWLGTAFGHQQAIKGVQVDCTNFIARTAEASRALPDVAFESNYRRSADGLTMLAILRDYMDFIQDVADALPADVIALCDEACKHPDVPRHLILLTQVEPHWMGIHASEHGVREHRLDNNFKRRIHSVWRLRDLED